MANERLFTRCPETPKTEIKEHVHFLTSHIVIATERGAIAAARSAGMGNKKYSDQMATDAMREYLNTLPIRGTVVAGEGERDEAPMLNINEVVGNGTGMEVDIAVDPLENTNATAFFGDGAISTLALTEKGGLFHTPDTIYMDKLVVGPWARGLVSLEKSPEENLNILADTLDRNVSDLVVVVLDRPRNDELIADILKTGARVKKIRDGDLMPGIASCFRGSGVHAQMGIGAAPEGVITATAVKCFGGEMQVKFWPSPKEKGKDVERLKEMGGELDKIYSQNELVKGKMKLFVATGVTDSEILRGVSFFGDGLRTHSVTILHEDGEIKPRIQFIDNIYLFRQGTPVTLT